MAVRLAAIICISLVSRVSNIESKHSKLVHSPRTKYKHSTAASSHLQSGVQVKIKMVLFGVRPDDSIMLDGKPRT